MNYLNLLYIDIETASKFKSLSDLEKNDKVGYNLFMDKFHKKRKTNKDWEFNTEDEAYFTHAPLMAEYGQIICVSIGYFKPNEPDNIQIEDIWTGSEKASIKNEADIMKRTAAILNNATKKQYLISGYNIKNFDLPYLFKKMFKYNIQCDCINFDGKKPWETPVKDLFDIWKNGGSNMSSYCSLEEALYELNHSFTTLSGKIGKTIPGDKINEEYWINNNLSGIVEHCHEDIENTAIFGKILFP